MRALLLTALLLTAACKKDGASDLVNDEDSGTITSATGTGTVGGTGGGTCVGSS